MIDTVAGIVVGAPMVGCLPLLVVIACNVKRAENYGLNPGGYLFITVVGWFLGLVLCALGAMAILSQLEMLREVDPAQLAVLLFFALVGGTVGGGAGYIMLWMRTVRHADFEELVCPPLGSQVAHIPQPRDRDDVFPE